MLLIKEKTVRKTTLFNEHNDKNDLRLRLIFVEKTKRIQLSDYVLKVGKTSEQRMYNTFCNHEANFTFSQ